MHPFARGLLMLALLGLLAGCGSSIDVRLTDPPGARMHFEDRVYRFGSDEDGTVRLPQFAELGAEEDEGVPVRFELPDPDDPRRTVAAAGRLFCYEVDLGDTAELYTPELAVTPIQVRRLRQGGAVTLKGYDPSGRVLYRIDLKREES
jgi:hypothetical protein